MSRNSIATYIDKVNFCYTPILLIILAVVAFFAQHNSHPECWTPAPFTEAMVDYAEKYCGSTSSYFTARTTDEIQLNKNIAPHNWVAWILLIQAFLFFIPYLIWKALLAVQNGLDIQTLASLTEEATKAVDPKGRKQVFDSIVGYFHSHLITKKASVILTLCYILVTTLYMVNTTVQLMVLDNFLLGQPFYGFSVVRSLFKGQEWPDSKAFPAVILCDFEVRALGNLIRHSVQCVIPMNLAFEKMFIAIWFWILFCLFLNICSLLYWTMVSLFSFLRVKFIGRYIAGTLVIEGATDNDFLWNFAANFLGVDGVFCLRFFNDSFGYFTVGQIIRGLLEKHIAYKSPDLAHKGGARGDLSLHGVQNNNLNSIYPEPNLDEFKGAHFTADERPYSPTFVSVEPSLYPSAPEEE